MCSTRARVQARVKMCAKRVETRAKRPLVENAKCVETCAKRPLVENACVAGPAENAQWPVTCDAAGSIAAGRSSQPGRRGGLSLRELIYFFNKRSRSSAGHAAGRSSQPGCSGGLSLRELIYFFNTRSTFDRWQCCVTQLTARMSWRTLPTKIDLLFQ